MALTTDTSYIERWADRPKPPAPAAPAKSRPLANGTPSRDPGLLRRFREAWLRGHSKKVIARDLGISTSLQGRLRVELDLPARQPPKGASTADHECTIRFGAALWVRIERRCHERGLRKAKYIRYLIERDLEGMGR